MPWIGGLKLAVTITSSDSVNQYSKACIQHLKAETTTPIFLVMSKPFFPKRVITYSLAWPRQKLVKKLAFFKQVMVITLSSWRGGFVEMFGLCKMSSHAGNWWWLHTTVASNFTGSFMDTAQKTKAETSKRIFPKIQTKAMANSRKTHFFFLEMSRSKINILEN